MQTPSGALVVALAVDAKAIEAGGDTGKGELDKCGRWLESQHMSDCHGTFLLPCFSSLASSGCHGYQLTFCLKRRKADPKMSDLSPSSPPEY